MNDKGKIFDFGAIETIRTKLLKKKETIAVAESVTNGLLQAAFSHAMEASAFYHGGITAYHRGKRRSSWILKLFTQPIVIVFQKSSGRNGPWNANA